MENTKNYFRLEQETARFILYLSPLLSKLTTVPTTTTGIDGLYFSNGTDLGISLDCVGEGVNEQLRITGSYENKPFHLFLRPDGSIRFERAGGQQLTITPDVIRNKEVYGNPLAQVSLTLANSLEKMFLNSSVSMDSVLLAAQNDKDYTVGQKDRVKDIYAQLKERLYVHEEKICQFREAACGLDLSAFEENAKKKTTVTVFDPLPDIDKLTGIAYDLKIQIHPNTKDGLPILDVVCHQPLATQPHITISRKGAFRNAHIIVDQTNISGKIYKRGTFVVGGTHFALSTRSLFQIQKYIAPALNDLAKKNIFEKGGENRNVFPVYNALQIELPGEKEEFVTFDPFYPTLLRSLTESLRRMTRSQRRRKSF